MRTESSLSALGYADVREGPVRILRALSATLQKQLMYRNSLDGETNKKRTLIAQDAALIWAKEIRGYEIDEYGQRRPTIKPEFLLCPLTAALDAATDDQIMGTLAGTFVSQRFLDIFMYKLPLITGGKIMTDFSDQPSGLDQTVSTRKVVVPAVVSLRSDAGRPTVIPTAGCRQMPRKPWTSTSRWTNSSACRSNSTSLP